MDERVRRKLETLDLQINFFSKCVGFVAAGRCWKYVERKQFFRTASKFFQFRKRLGSTVLLPKFLHRRQERVVSFRQRSIQVEVSSFDLSTARILRGNSCPIKRIDRSEFAASVKLSWSIGSSMTGNPDVEKSRLTHLKFNLSQTGWSVNALARLLDTSSLPRSQQIETGGLVNDRRRSRFCVANHVWKCRPKRCLVTCAVRSAMQVRLRFTKSLSENLLSAHIYNLVGQMSGSVGVNDIALCKPIYGCTAGFLTVGGSKVVDNPVLIGAGKAISKSCH